jgi:hypothetical protein
MVVVTPLGLSLLKENFLGARMLPTHKVISELVSACVRRGILEVDDNKLLMLIRGQE